MPVLFTEYDGVLHTDEAYVARGRLDYVGPGQLFEYTPALARLIAPYPAINLVLSTPWVKTFGLHAALQALSPELRMRVVGATFDRRFHSAHWAGMTRCEQILDYVERYGITRWVALDASYDSAWPRVYRDRLVRTHRKLCLGEPRVQAELAAKLREMTS